MRENDVRVKENNASNPLVRWGIFAAIVLVAFLAGLIPMMMQKWSVQSELETTQKQLRKSEIKNFLTSAIVEADRGEYEPARQNASEYFTQLRKEQEKTGDASFLKGDERDKLKPIFDARDTIITMLAQRDPASVERLTNIYSAYQQTMGVPQPPASGPPTDPKESPAANVAETPAANIAP